MESLSIAAPNFQKLLHQHLNQLHASDEYTVTMADEDEDISHLGAPDAADIDLTEETQDFRFLDKLMCELS